MTVTNTYTFGVRAAWVASYTSVGVYGSLIKLNAINQVEAKVTTVNGVLEGDDIHAALHAQPVGVSLRIKFGAGAQFPQAIACVTGASVASSSETKKWISFGAGNYPYVGFFWQSYQTDGVGDNLVWMPMVKLMDGFTYALAYGGFNTPEMNFQGIPDDGNRFFVPTWRATASTPTTYSDFIPS